MVDLDAHTFEPGPQAVADVGDAGCPQQTADDIERQEAPVVHLACASDDWREGAYDRYETGNDDCLATMLLIKGLRSLNVLLFKEARVGFSEDARAGFATKPVADGVAQYSSKENDEDGSVDIDVEDPCVNQEPGREQKAVAWQEEANK